MGTTANRNYPYPDPTDPADMAGALQNLAEAVDTDVEALSLLAVPPPMAVVTGNDSSLNIISPGVETAMNYTAVNFDNDSLANLAALPDRLTVVTAGVYYIHFSAKAPDVTTMLDAFIRIDGVDYGRVIHEGNAIAGPFLVISAMADVTAGQVIRGTVIQNTATVQTIFTPRLMAYRVA